MIAATSLVIIVVSVSHAYAQSAEAEALFNEGDKLMSEGKLAQACEAFEASNRIESRAGTLIRIGQCREQNQQFASAWSAYRDALTRAKDPEKSRFAEARSAAIEPKLSYLTISVPDDSRVDGLAITRNGKPLDAGLWNRAVPVDGGTYVIAVHAPGTENWKTSVIVPVENGKVTVDVPKLKESPNRVSPSSPMKSEQPGMFTGRRKISVGLAVVGTASLVTGILLGVSAKNNESDAFALCDPQIPCDNAARAEELIRSGHNLSIGADVMFGVAGAAVIGAVVLWLTGSPVTSRQIAVAPTARGMTLLGTF